MYRLKLKKYLVVKTAVVYIEPRGEVKHYNWIDCIVKLMKVVGQQQSNAKGAHSITGTKRKNVPLGIDVEAEEAEEDEKEEGEQDQSEGNEDDDRNENEEGERGNIVPKLNIEKERKVKYLYDNIGDIDFTTLVCESTDHKRSSRGVQHTHFYMTPVHDMKGRLVFFTIDGANGARHYLAVYKKRK